MRYDAPMRLTVPTPEERPALFELLGQSFHVPADGWALFAARLGEGNLRVAKVDGAMVGGLGVYPLGQWFGGRAVPMGGVAGVGIAPEHRGKGLAARMVAGSLAELREAGVPLAGLYASTQTVYRSVGFEQAGNKVEWAVRLSTVGVVERGVDVRPAEGPTELLPLYRPAHGNLDRSAAIWSRILAPRGEPARAYRVGERGYVVFSQETRKGEDIHYDLVVRDWGASTPAEARRLWTFLADHRSLAVDVRWWGAAADPMVALLPEATWETRRLSRWMLRLVDVAGALRARGWPAGCRGELHLDVRDAVLPGNEGRYVLTVEDGVAEVREGGRGDLVADVRGLAPLYSGLFDAHTLRALGWIAGDDATIGTAARLFASPEPWMSDHF